MANIANEAVRSVAFGSITGTYANLGAATSNAALSLTVYNGTDERIQISRDSGTTTWLDMPPNTSYHGYFGVPNRLGTLTYVQSGTQFQIRHAGSAPTDGHVSITLEYN